MKVFADVLNKETGELEERQISDYDQTQWEEVKGWHKYLKAVLVVLFILSSTGCVKEVSPPHTPPLPETSCVAPTTSFSTTSLMPTTSTVLVWVCDNNFGCLEKEVIEEDIMEEIITLVEGEWKSALDYEIRLSRYSFNQEMLPVAINLKLKTPEGEYVNTQVSLGGSVDVAGLNIKSLDESRILVSK